MKVNVKDGKYIYPFDLQRLPEPKVVAFINSNSLKWLLSAESKGQWAGLAIGPNESENRTAPLVNYLDAQRAIKEAFEQGVTSGKTNDWV